MATKKDIDKANMYKKLMPTGTRSEPRETSLYYSEEAQPAAAPSLSAEQPEQLAHPENQLIYNPAAHKTFAKTEEDVIIEPPKTPPLDPPEVEPAPTPTPEPVPQPEPVVQPEPIPEVETSEEFELINLQHELIKELLETAYKKYKCCDCERCRKDIVAVALNMLSPSYTVVKTGEVTTDFPPQMRSEAASAVVKAMLQVRTKPNH